MQIKCFFNIFIRRFHGCYNCNSGPFLSHKIFVVVVPNTACGESLLIIKMTILAFCSGFCNTTRLHQFKKFPRRIEYMYLGPSGFLLSPTGVRKPLWWMSSRSEESERKIHRLVASRLVFVSLQLTFTNEEQTRKKLWVKG